MSVSTRLAAAVESVFSEYVLPAFQRELQGGERDLLVMITSSVAYDVADAHSDLDVFVVFRRDSDYRRHVASLERMLASLAIPSEYRDICDKGVRFELESLVRSDVSRVFHRPRDRTAWVEQTDWLMHWFVNGRVIYDPSGLRPQFERRCGAYPAHVLASRQRDARIRMSRWARTATSLGPGFRRLRAMWRAASASLDLAYSSAGHFGPHPKWRLPLARQALANPSSLELLNHVDHLTAVATTTGAIDSSETDATLRSLVAAGGAGSRPDIEQARDPSELERHAHGLAPRTWVLRQPFIDDHVASAALAAVAAGDAVYTATELGVTRACLASPRYDDSMRVSDVLRTLWSRSGSSSLPRLGVESKAIHRRRLRYLHFVIWRKIRVVAKAGTRGQVFNRIWYALQVIEHLIEANARLAGGLLPPLEELTPEIADAIDLGTVATRKRWKSLLGDDATALLGSETESLLELLWDTFGVFQQRLAAEGIVSPAEAAAPLQTQFEIQYWKYENLFI